MFFPAEEFDTTDGESYAGVLHMAPTIGSTAAERFLAASISGARKTLYITAAYFVPDDDFRRMLRAAVRRGVDVRILAASDKTDVPVTRYAGRSNFEELLESGVRIYEYQPSMVHAKTMVIDGIFSSVGTMNFDNRSLAFNDETNLIALDRRLASRLEEVFLEDLEYAKEITLEEFRRRPFGQKVKERLSRTISRLL
jgi:cardiolipin synthase